MSIWNIIIIVVYFIFIFYLRHRIQKRRGKKKWDPFKLWKMITTIKRKDGSTFEREFKRFEYIGQKLDEGEIVSIYHVYEMSEKQKKWEEYCKKFR